MAHEKFAEVTFNVAGAIRETLFKLAAEARAMYGLTESEAMFAAVLAAQAVVYRCNRSAGVKPDEVSKIEQTAREIADAMWREDHFLPCGDPECKSGVCRRRAEVQERRPDLEVKGGELARAFCERFGFPAADGRRAATAILDSALRHYSEHGAAVAVIQVRSGVNFYSARIGSRAEGRGLTLDNLIPSIMEWLTSNPKPSAMQLIAADGGIKARRPGCTCEVTLGDDPECATCTGEAPVISRVIPLSPN